MFLFNFLTKRNEGYLWEGRVSIQNVRSLTVDIISIYIFHRGDMPTQEVIPLYQKVRVVLSMCFTISSPSPPVISLVRTWFNGDGLTGRFNDKRK